MRCFVALFLCWLCSSAAFAAEVTHPDCTAPNRWPASIAGVTLKNLGLSTQAGGYEHISVQRLASEPLAQSPPDRTLFRQVHKVTIHDKGAVFVAITVNDASREECSESNVDVYWVAIECGENTTCQAQKGQLK